MNNFNFLINMQKLQFGIMYDNLIDLEFAIIGYSKTDKSAFWNLALTNRVLRNDEIFQVEDKFKELDRAATIYFESRRDLDSLASTLSDYGYKKGFEDSWQFWKCGDIDNKNFDSVKIVTTPEKLKTYLETFNACYQKNDPQNPYGELGDYLKVAEAVWHKHNKSNRLEYFIIYKGDKPVAVSTLTNFEGIGYISNVGSLREVRGEGYGKTATLYCIQQSIKNGNDQHCLATEEGAYPNEFYKRVGFEIRFTAVGYIKQ